MHPYVCKDWVGPVQNLHGDCPSWGSKTPTCCLSSPALYLYRERERERERERCVSIRLMCFLLVSACSWRPQGPRRHPWRSHKIWFLHAKNQPNLMSGTPTNEQSVFSEIAPTNPIVEISSWTLRVRPDKRGEREREREIERERGLSVPLCLIGCSLCIVCVLMFFSRFICLLVCVFVFCGLCYYSSCFSVYGSSCIMYWFCSFAIQACVCSFARCSVYYRVSWSVLFVCFQFVVFFLNLNRWITLFLMYLSFWCCVLFWLCLLFCLVHSWFDSSVFRRNISKQVGLCVTMSWTNVYIYI